MAYGFRLPAWRSLRPLPVKLAKLEYDEELEAFVPLAIGGGKIRYVQEAVQPGSLPAARRLPDELYCREFLEVDPKDPASLAAFQDEHGPLVSPMRRQQDGLMAGTAHFTPEPAFDPGVKDEFHSIECDAIRESAEKLARFKESCGVRDFGWGWAFLSLEEAQVATRNAQLAIRFLTDIAKRKIEDTLDFDGVDNHSDALTARYYCRFISNCLGRSLPVIDYVNGGGPDYAVPVITAVFAQLVSALASGDTFKECPVCGRTFQWKTNGGVSSRYPNAKYCSDECYRRANREQWNETKKRKRREAREERKGRD